MPLPRPAPDPEPSPRFGRGPALAVSGLVVVAAVVGFSSSRFGPFEAGRASGPVALPAPEVSGRPAPSVAGVTPSAAQASTEPTVSEGEATDWFAILARLDATRSAILSQPRAATSLTEVDLAGSAVLNRDEVIRHSLAARGLHAAGLRIHVEEVSVQSASAIQAQLLVTDTMAAYELLGSGEKVVQHQAARGRRRWLVTLRRTGRGWRYESIEAAAPEAADGAKNES